MSSLGALLLWLFGIMIVIFGLAGAALQISATKMRREEEELYRKEHAKQSKTIS